MGTKSRGVFLMVAYVAAGISLCGSSGVAQPNVWATAYYAGWQQGWSNNGHLPAQEIDYSAMTHIVHFSLVPNSNGTLNPDANSITQINSTELLSRAHAAGRKVLISVGGWASDVGFRGATSATNRALFVANLVTFMTTRGYDGIDIDWEVLQSSDASQFTAFITALRTALNAVQPRPLLTAATSWQPSIFAQVHSQFDQINIMTYDMSGAWPGWVTWHNSPIYDGGYRFPSTSGLVPSINGSVDGFIAAGIPAGKLGAGIDFYGFVWNGGDGTPTGGATQPRQEWTVAPTVQDNIPYYTIMQSYYQQSNYRWDAVAQAAYLQVDNAGSPNDKFISYDNETSVQKKFDYARSKGIGGLIVWELGGGYRPELPAGQRDPLLQAVKTALGGGSVPDTTRPNVSITTPANGSAVSGTVAVTASASDNRAVAGVRFAVDGVSLGNEVTIPPYTLPWNTVQSSNGPHTVSATARDAAGNQSTANVNVTVVNSTADTTRPTVSIISPVNGATVSGTTTINANAADDRGVAGVRFALDGAPIGNEVTVPPYTMSWNTSQTVNGPHVVSATARDAAGNQATANINVSVSNAPPPPTSDMHVYQDALLTPWINTSWSATINFASTERVYAGANAIKVVQNAWGAVSLHSGQWGSSVSIDPTRYSRVEFAVYPLSSALSLGAMFENDLGGSFPGVSYGTLPANQWTLVSIDMSRLDPGNQVIHRLNIQDISGVPKTYYVDIVRFVGVSTVTVASPALLLPANGSRGISRTVELKWDSSAGASSYRVQASYRSDFATTIVDQSGLTARTLVLSALGKLRTIYWRVNASNAVATSAWSNVWSFTTGVTIAGTVGSPVGKPGLTSLELEGNEVPTSYGLAQNYPNPFNPATVITFSIPEDAEVSVTIFNALGEEVATLVSGYLPAGTYRTMWNAAGFASGFYVCRMSTKNFSETRKLLLTK